MAKSHKHTFEYVRYADITEMPEGDQRLIELAEKELANAYAPYSRFHVGAVVQLQSGAIYSGNNQENVAYPSGLCAERVALFHAMSKNPGAVVSTVAIAAEAQDFELSRIITPCGSCRQAMLEYEVNSASPIRLLMGSSKGEVIEVPSVLSLLPLSFCETQLKKE
jgi:cytidine deaminase